jgi:cytochrome c oxidase assembly protein subunit 15
MGDEWVPDEILKLQPQWRNFFENTATVQFDHRVLALTSLSSIAAMFLIAKRGAGGQLWNLLPSTSRKFLHSAIGMAGVQVGLGITTLLLYVPIPLAASHQFGSLVLLTLSTGVVHSLRFVRFLPTTTSMAAAAAAASTTAPSAASATAAGVAAAMGRGLQSPVTGSIGLLKNAV